MSACFDGLITAVETGVVWESSGGREGRGGRGGVLCASISGTDKPVASLGWSLKCHRSPIRHLK